MFKVTVNGVSKVWMNKNKQELVEVLPLYYGIPISEVLIEEIKDAEKEVKLANNALTAEEQQKGIFCDILLKDGVPTITKIKPIATYNKEFDQRFKEAQAVLKENMDAPSKELSEALAKEEPTTQAIYDTLVIKDEATQETLKQLLGLTPIPAPELLNSGLIIDEEVKTLTVE